MADLGASVVLGLVQEPLYPATGEGAFIGFDWVSSVAESDKDPHETSLYRDEVLTALAESDNAGDTELMDGEQGSLLDGTDFGETIPFIYNEDSTERALRGFDTDQHDEPTTIFAGGVIVVATVDDVTSPVFAGIVSLGSPTSSSLTATWADGSDNATPVASLVYEIHWSTVASDTFVVKAASDPGATSHVIPDLRPGTTYYVRVRARDKGGNTSTSNGPELSATTLGSPPSVENISPAPGTGIGIDTAVTFDVLDASGLRRVILIASYVGDATEVIHDGTGFRGPFNNVWSSRTAIPNGFRYTVRRRGGWSTAPTIEVIAIDVTGEEL